MTKVSRRLSLGLALSLGLILAVSAVCLSGSILWSRLAHRVSLADRELDLLQQCLSGIFEAETAERGYIITGAARYLPEFETARKRTGDALAALESPANAFPELRGGMLGLSPLVRARLAELAAIVQVRGVNGVSAVEARMANGNGFSAMEEIRGRIKSMQIPEASASASAQSQMNAIQRLTAALSASGSFLAIFILGFSLRQAEARKRKGIAAQEAASFTKTRFESFIDNIPAVVSVKDSENRMVYGNSMREKLLGVRPDTWHRRGPPPSHAPHAPHTLGADPRRVLEENRAIEFVETLPLANGEIRTFLTVKFPVASGEGAPFLGAVALDITERENALAAMRAGDSLNRSIFENSNDFIKVLSLDGRVIVANSNRDLEGPGLAVGTAWTDCWVAEADRRMAEHAIHGARSGRVERFEGGSHRFHGSGKWWDVAVSPIRENGVPERLLVISRDITERVASERRFRALFDSAANPILLIRKRVVLDCNAAALSMFGAKDAAPIVGRSPAYLLAPQQPDGASADSVVLDLCEESGRGGTVKRDLLHHRLNGEEFWAEVSMRVIEIDGQPTRFMALNDLTERNRMHEALRQSEERFHLFMENSPSLVFIKDRAGRMIYMNKICRKMWRFDHLDWKGKTDAELWSPELAEGFRKLDLKVLDSETPGVGIDVVPLPDGGICSLLTHKFAIRLPSGEKLVAGTCIDITEQKEAERRLVAALSEKETLFKEVHHRVKNNLQVVSSLLHMKMGTLSDETAIAALSESADRVQSMALVHEMLYGTESLRDIRFTDYASQLLAEVSASFGERAGQVALRIVPSSIRLDLDRAIPCGLILNELVSNSLKYAFPAGRAGSIEVSLVEHEPSRVRLSVQDDGVGLPAEFHLHRAESLGLRIVDILSKQLGGGLTVESRQGTRFEVVFPLG